MNRFSESKGASPNRFLQFLFGQWAHENETATFILVSVLDFFCTYALLTVGPANGGGAVESNPVANWFLVHFGFVKGLLAFKLSMVLFVCGLSQALSYSKPNYGRGVLLFGIVLTFGVVIYSLVLLLR